VRLADLFRLALGALWQQKVRTVLTTLGVLFGSFALVVSLSVGQGVQETVVREISRHGDLRTIEVYPGGATPAEDIPSEKREVHGSMSEERRQRLQDELTRRWRWAHRPRPATPLTRERVAQLATLEHVRSVVPSETHLARIVLGDRVEQGTVLAAGPDNEHFRNRVIAGSPLTAGDDQGALVTEFLLYRLGVADDDDLQKAVDHGTLHLEFRIGTPNPNLLLTLMSVNGESLSVREEKMLNEVVGRLPEVIAKSEQLSIKDKAALAKLLARPPEKRDGPEPKTIVAEYPIRGVLRTAKEDETKGRWSWAYQQADVVLGPVAAEDLFARFPEHERFGYGSVQLEVDDVDHVKEVTTHVKEMGLTTSSLLERVEVERFIYLLVFGAMSMVAVMAVAVAGLGILNTMLMGVLERVREIGVMKAVGARDGHVQLMFLVEGFLLGLVGGLLGLLLGWAASFPGDAWVRSMVARNISINLTESVFVFPLWLTVGAPLFAAVVTTVAAVYPARRASRVNPVTALRHE
jgi:putative ABC transport system permease protein